MKTIIIIIATFTSAISIAQSSVENLVKGGELILSGISIFKVAKSNPKSNSKTVESICVKNKLGDKIIFKLTGTDQEQNEIKKELVIPKEGRECLLEVPKGIYTYEITKANNDVYKKGEYKLDEQITIIVKDE
jgi:hypothetical protein